VEFGLVAAPFLALTFAIVETALVFFSGQVLETATAESARLIMTGQAQTQGFDQAAFKNAVCSHIFGLFDCESGIYVDVKSYPNFSQADDGISQQVQVDKDGKLKAVGDDGKLKDFGFTPGGPGDIVVVRVMYQWPVWVSILGFDLSDLSGGKRLLVATSAFRNEPYGG
jgi:Flp pilus assembly protein TadG